MRNRLELTVLGLDGSASIRAIDVMSVMGTGFSNRDRQAARQISESRRRQGLAWTSKDYWTFRIGSYLLTTAHRIEVQGPLTGGEVEAVAIFAGQDAFVGVGSDHCDRELSSAYLEKPKQMCPHPLSPQVWRLEDVAGHWDDLQLESEVRVGQTLVTTHKFALSELVSLHTWIERCNLHESADATFFYCGVGAALPELTESLNRLGLPPETARGVGDEFRMRMYDPVLKREIRHAYKVEVLGDDLEERRSR